MIRQNPVPQLVSLLGEYSRKLFDETDKLRLFRREYVFASRKICSLEDIALRHADQAELVLQMKQTMEPLAGYASQVLEHEEIEKVARIDLKLRHVEFEMALRVAEAELSKPPLPEKVSILQHQVWPCVAAALYCIAIAVVQILLALATGCFLSFGWQFWASVPTGVLVFCFFLYRYAGRVFRFAQSKQKVATDVVKSSLKIPQKKANAPLISKEALELAAGTEHKK